MKAVIGVGKKIPVKTFTENQIISMAVEGITSIITYNNTGKTFSKIK